MNTKYHTRKPDNATPQFRAVPNAHGGWSIRTADGTAGNYPTKRDAERVIELNGGGR